MEAVVIMVVYLTVLAVVIRSFFVLERSVNAYCNTVQEEQSIENTINAMRRLQWLSGREE